MTYTAHTRDGYRRALAAVTGLTTVGALTACGWLAGVAARDHGADQDSKNAARQQAQRRALADWQRQRDAWRAAQADQRPRVRTVWKKHPEVTVVDTRVVRAASIGSGGGAQHLRHGAHLLRIVRPQRRLRRGFRWRWGRRWSTARRAAAAPTSGACPQLGILT